MTPAPNEALFVVVGRRADKAYRARMALVLVLVCIASWVLMQQGGLLGVSWEIWMLPMLLGDLVLAWRAGLFARVRALMQLGSIRRDGLRATEMLTAGDVEGAKHGYAELLSRARPLGAFHATHVLMYGVTRFIEGGAREGLKLASRALDSGWFDSATMKPMGQVAETWRILMLLDLGERAEARARLASAPSLPTAALAVDACDERWSDVVDRALRTLDDAKFPPGGRPTVALLGRHAARQIEHEALARFEAVLSAEPLPELTRKNPAYRRFL
jgi:hypothetical protein